MFEKSSLSRWKLVVLIIATICGTAVFSLCVLIEIHYVSSNLGEDSSVRYSVETDNLSGIPAGTPVTLLFPLPLVEGKPVIPNDRYSPGSRGWNSIIPGWNSAVVRTEHGQMLAFTSTISPLQDISVTFVMRDSPFEIPGIHYTSLTFSPEFWDAVPQYALSPKDIADRSYTSRVPIVLSEPAISAISSESPMQPEIFPPMLLPTSEAHEKTEMDISHLKYSVNRTDTAPTLMVLPDLTAAEDNILVVISCSVTKPWRITGTPSALSGYVTTIGVSIPPEDASGEIPVMPLVPEGSYRHQGETEAGRDCMHLTYFF